MALITPDFTEVQDNVTPGTYRVRIADATTGVWEAKDDRPATHFVNWRLETFGESEPKNNGRSIFVRTALTGKGAFRLRDLYSAAMAQELNGAFDTDMLMGKELEVTVQQNQAGYTDVKTFKRIQ